MQPWQTLTPGRPDLILFGILKDIQQQKHSDMKAHNVATKRCCCMLRIATTTWWPKAQASFVLTWNKAATVSHTSLKFDMETTCKKPVLCTMFVTIRTVNHICPFAFVAVTRTMTLCYINKRAMHTSDSRFTCNEILYGTWNWCGLQCRLRVARDLRLPLHLRQKQASIDACLEKLNC